ncbi:MAG: hypothetical protein FWD66_08770 [Paludibacter sp.]|nr:hypothetical protein [Paludibacter sp.]
MKTAVKKAKKEKKSLKTNEEIQQKPKSAYTLFREKYPNGIGEIVNMRAVLR